ncbi:MAG TPA: hypothetical protein VG621_00560 [Candidatus Paceibacterota bacterium]|nr:hypothetical protein [Candidatus Paceibacterota bacterium]
MTITTKKVIQSFIIVPLVATTFSVNTFTASINQAVAKTTTPVVAAPTPEESALQESEKREAAKIDAYFTQYDLPLAGHGMTFVTEAQKSGIPWTLLPAIAMAESTGCKYVIAGTNNCFGWGSGKIKFSSIDDAIAEISKNLGGNDPDTAQYYDGKSVKEILEMYNPPRIAPGYQARVLRIMADIDKAQI